MIISQTPLRISFAGGGTDLKAFYSQEEGWVISSAIDKFIFVIVKERFDDKIYINYSKKEIVDEVDQIEHDLVREAMKKTGTKNGVEITTLADIPSAGSGLGSSSSVTVGLLNALYAYNGEQVTAEQLAREACEIEIDILGKPIGKQDQYIAAYGGLRFFRFRPDEQVDVEKVCLENGNNRKFGANLLLFYTGKTRKADAILTEQKEQTSNKMYFLREIKKQAMEIKDLLCAREYNQVGDVLRRTWQLKKELAKKITNGDIEEMFNSAMEAGALGGKISGAGGGGFLMLYCPREKQNQLRDALKGYREFPFFLEKHGSRIIFNMRSYEWK
ncbi:GHMP kinase [candidate division KSB1 bacterium]|nr:GHMP kinase [candidate division KSB1 bacterium]